MKYSESLKKNKDFQLVYKCGKSYANKYLVMYIKENNTGKNRLGISVSKKVGNSIVRHRLTRLIRESYRLQEDRFRCGIDIVVIARIGAKGRTYKDIESALLHLGRLHEIIDLAYYEKDYVRLNQVLSEIFIWPEELFYMYLFSNLLSVCCRSN